MQKIIIIIKHYYESIRQILVHRLSFKFQSVFCIKFQVSFQILKFHFPLNRRARNSLSYSSRFTPLRTVSDNRHHRFWGDRLLSVRCMSVCNVRALWPNGWTDQDEALHCTQIGLGPGHTVLDGDPAPSPQWAGPNKTRVAGTWGQGGQLPTLEKIRVGHAQEILTVV